MREPPVLTAGLQEWATTCRALGDGRVMLLVRKGGIHERGGGLFQPEQARFALMPTYLHQDQVRIQAPFVADYQASKVDPEPGLRRIELWADVAAVWKATDLTTLQMLGPELLWTPHELATRFAYRDEPWLYVLALRVRRLAEPLAFPDQPAFAGCRSWLTLPAPLPTVGSVPVLSAGYFESRLDRISQVLSPGRTVSRSMSSPGRKPRS